MDHHEVLLEKVEEDLQITESRLDKASARESLTQLAKARQKFDEKHFSLRLKSEETSQYLSRLV